MCIERLSCWAQAWLQEFAWLEPGCGAAMESRAAHNPAVREQLMKEPLFCFETAASAPSP